MSYSDPPCLTDWLPVLKSFFSEFYHEKLLCKLTDLTTTITSIHQSIKHVSLNETRQASKYHLNWLFSCGITTKVMLHFVMWHQIGVCAKAALYCTFLFRTFYDHSAGYSYNQNTDFNNMESFGVSANGSYSANHILITRKTKLPLNRHQSLTLVNSMPFTCLLLTCFTLFQQ